MPTDPTKKTGKSPSGDEGLLTKVKSLLSSKKSRGILIASVIIVLGLIGVIYGATQGDSKSDEGHSSSPVEVQVPSSSSDNGSDESEKGNSNDEPTPADDDESASAEPSEDAPSESTDDENSDEPKPEDVPPGNPQSRGDLPKEFPLPDSYSYAGSEEKDGKKVINGTVSDTSEAIKILDYNLTQHYSVRARTVDTNSTSGYYLIQGSGMPAGTKIVISGDGTFQVRIPKG